MLPPVLGISATSVVLESKSRIIFLEKILRKIFQTNVCLRRCAGLSLFRNHDSGPWCGRRGVVRSLPLSIQL